MLRSAVNTALFGIVLVIVFFSGNQSNAPTSHYMTMEKGLYNLFGSFMVCHEGNEKCQHGI